MESKQPLAYKKKKTKTSTVFIRQEREKKENPEIKLRKGVDIKQKKKKTYTKEPLKGWLFIEDKLEDESSLELKPGLVGNPTKHLSDEEDLGLKDDEREAAGLGLESLEMVAIEEDQKITG